MKRFFALLLVLVITVSCLASCSFISGIFGDGSGNGGDSTGEGEGSNTENPSEIEKDPVIEEDDGDVDIKDNIDPDAWIKVEK